MTGMFRDLDPDEAAEFREWARANWKPGDAINPVWHPVVRDECRAIEAEAAPPIVVDAASGLWLDGAPNDYLVSRGRGHATLYQGIWFYRTDDDVDGASYRAVVVLPRRNRCIGDGCARTCLGAIAPGHHYLCPEHVVDVLGDGPADDATMGVDMSTTAEVQSTRAGRPAKPRTRAASRRKEPDMPRKATSKDGAEAIAMLASERKARRPRAEPEPEPVPTSRRCKGSSRFGIEAHDAPISDFPKQPSRPDGLGVMCTEHWRAYVKGLRQDALARKAAEGEVVTITESAPDAPPLPRVRRSRAATEPVGAAKVREAQALLASIDAMPGPESVKAIGTREAQDALELLGTPEARMDVAADDE